MSSHIKEKTVKIDPRILKRLDQELETLNSFRPLKPEAAKRLQEQFSIEMNFHSNAIEGNRLTLKETFLVLKQGITIKGKNLQEHLEAKNQQEAIEYLYEIVDSKRKLTISHQLIRELQHLVVKDTVEQAGRYRKTDVSILGSAHIPPPGYQVQAKMDELLHWISSNEKKYHPVIFAALIHHLFVYIHPFEDGNGRTGRLLMNLFLMRKGYPISIILKNDRNKYYDVLEEADHGNMSAFLRFICTAVERSLGIYIKAIGGTKKAQDNYLPISQIAKQTPYTSKYINLLIGKGLIKAEKRGRNWYTTANAVKSYEATRVRKRAAKKPAK